MAKAYLSFYLKAGRIHIYTDALREIGSPARICFMSAEDGKTLLLAPYENRDLKSHCVPAQVYRGGGSMEVSSIKLCRMIAELYSWDISKSYRIPGRICCENRAVIFEFAKAEIIEKKQ